MSKVKTNVRPLNVIAQEIVKEWNNVHEFAKPYLAAMLTLPTIEDNYILDSGREIVARFLGNAGTWRGETARRVKKELNAMLK